MSIAERAKEVHRLELRSRLEATQCGQFVAIEPVSKAFFPGATFIEAALAAKKCPDRNSSGDLTNSDPPLIEGPFSDE